MRSRSSLLSARLGVPTWADDSAVGAIAQPPAALARKPRRPSDCIGTLGIDSMGLPFRHAAFTRAADPRERMSGSACASIAGSLPAPGPELDHVADLVEIPHPDLPGAVA